MGILTLLYALCIHQGIWSIEQKTEKTIVYSNGSSYKRKSIFRQGLSSLKVIIRKTTDLITFIKKIIINHLHRKSYSCFKERISFFYSQ